MRISPVRRHSFVVWRVLLAALLVLMAALAVSCGGPNKAKLAAERTTYVAQLRSLVQTREATKREQVCRKQIGGFLDALRALDSKLDVGITFADYGNEVGNVKVEYDRMDSGSRLASDCLKAAASGEKAMTAYVRAHTEWNDCLNAEGSWSWDTDEFGFSNCTTDDVEASLQLDWLAATSAVTKANRLLNGIDKDIAALPTYADEVPADTSAVGSSIYGAIVEDLCATDVPLTATEPCTDLKEMLSDGIGDSELGHLNDDLKALAETYGSQPAPNAPGSDSGV